ncbi:hypothetical protein BDZ91DRAFT_719284 [Kalaharituber pfeilii]|nr:hypothetical protein BDZ91DRAFT_719284 [Kalaharituber pfeilii]
MSHQLKRLDDVTIENHSSREITIGADNDGTTFTIGSKQNKPNYTGSFAFVSFPDFGDVGTSSKYYKAWCSVPELANGTLIIELSDENIPFGRFLGGRGESEIITFKLEAE